MRRPRRLGCGALLAASFVGPSALAQDDRRPLLYARHHNYESPENFAIQVGVAPFTPDVDSDPALHGATPFADTFPGAHPLRLGAELDWEAVRIPHVGTIGPGLGIGYVNISGNAPVTNPAPGGPTTSGETTTLELYPLYAVGVFRADGPWKDHGIPFVPYAKLGLATTLWRASNTLGTSHYQGRAGEGYTLGTQATLGLAFVLNILDPYAAREFDESMGVNSTSIFAEWTDANLDGLFLQPDPLHVGGRYWTFGMVFTF